MRPTRFLGFLLVALVSLGAFGDGSVTAEPPEGFADWSPATFERARREGRVVVLMVSTSWCHWCHVMKRETYGDGRVKAVLARRFLPVYVDADARPDLAERFRRYRWPATAFLTPTGEPLLALRGYRSPDAFLPILERVERLADSGGPYPGFEDPNADQGPPRRAEGIDALIARLAARLDEAFDEGMAGWGRPQKYPLPDPVLDGLEQAFTAPARAWRSRDRALRTLQAEIALIDPVAGGMYQYSLEGRWDRWHPEKIVPVNAGALAGYAEALALTGEERWRDAGASIVRWLLGTLLQPGGGFGASQDADAPRLAGEQWYRLGAAERARYGVPRVDDNVYASENGQIAEALVRWSVVVGDDDALLRAEEAVTRVLAGHRDASGEVLTHKAGGDPARLFLVDYADLGSALVALATVRGRASEAGTRWLEAAAALARGMDARLSDPASGGWVDATVAPGDVGVFARPRASLDGVARALRFRLHLGASAEELARWQAALLTVADERAVDEHGPYGAGALRAARRLLAAQIGPETHVAVRAEGPSAEAVRREALGAALRDPRVRLDAPLTVGPAATVCAGDMCLEAADASALRRMLVEVLAEGPFR